MTDVQVGDVISLVAHEFDDSSAVRFDIFEVEVEVRVILEHKV